MKFELTRERLEEIACCIVDCGLDRDAACEYAIETAKQCMTDDAEVIEVNDD